MTAPSLSVIVPTYNRAGFVRECLLGLRRCGVPDLEVVVADDGSTDDTRAVVAATDPAAVYLWQPNSGTPSTARNAGFAVSRGRYVGFLDCDDQWLPGGPARAVELLDRYPEVGLVYGDTLVGNDAAGFESLTARYGRAAFDALPHRAPEPGFRVLDRDALFRRVAARNQWTVCAPVLRREVFAAAGMFDPTMREAEDWDLWLRVVGRATVGYMDRPMARYLVHPDGITARAGDRFALGFCRALRNALAGGRLAGWQRRLLRGRLRQQLYWWAYQAYDDGRLPDARARFGEAVRAGDRRPQTLALWAACHLPGPLVGWARQARRGAPA